MAGVVSTPPSTPSRIAVTGAAGKTGQHVVARLGAAGHDVRALVRDVAAAASGLPDATLVAGDLADVDDLSALLAGCQAVYHIPPNMSADELAFARALLAACDRAGVERVVYHSVLHPQIEAMPHHWAKLRVEELLLGSDLDVVLLQPAPYLQNLDPYLDAARSHHAAVFPYGAHVQLSMVDLHDVAEVAALVVVGAEHVGGAYQLCGSERLTQGQAWARACERLGLSVPYSTISLDAWRRTAGAQLPERVADWLGRMFTYYDEHGLTGSSLALTSLLGRAPRTLDDHLDDLVGPAANA